MIKRHISDFYSKFYVGNKIIQQSTHLLPWEVLNSICKDKNYNLLCKWDKVNKKYRCFGWNMCFFRYIPYTQSNKIKKR